MAITNNTKLPPLLFYPSLLPQGIPGFSFCSVLLYGQSQKIKQQTETIKFSFLQPLREEDFYLLEWSNICHKLYVSNSVMGIYQVARFPLTSKNKHCIPTPAPSCGQILGHCVHMGTTGLSAKGSGRVLNFHQGFPCSTRQAHGNN